MTKLAFNGLHDYAWEGQVQLNKDDDYFRAGFLEFKYHGLISDSKPPLPLPDRVPRGEGLTLSSAAVIVPDIKPNPDCGLKDGDDLAYDCFGSLV